MITLNYASDTCKCSFSVMPMQDNNYWCIAGTLTDDRVGFNLTAYSDRMELRIWKNLCTALLFKPLVSFETNYYFFLLPELCHTCPVKSSLGTSWDLSNRDNVTGWDIFVETKFYLAEHIERSKMSSHMINHEVETKLTSFIILFFLSVMTVIIQGFLSFKWKFWSLGQTWEQNILVSFFSIIVIFSAFFKNVWNDHSFLIFEHMFFSFYWQYFWLAHYYLM